VGEDTAIALFWDRTEPVWSPEERVTLIDNQGRRSRYEYRNVDNGENSQRSPSFSILFLLLPVRKLIAHSITAIEDPMVY
jgi:hypothetical protein